MKANTAQTLRRLFGATLGLGLCFSLYQTTAIAEIYKCTDAEGHLSISDTPCQTNSQSETIELEGVMSRPPAFNPSDYCQVVFERDYTLKDDFTNSSVQVSKGEKVLAGGFSELDSLYYLTDAGFVYFRFGSFVEDKPPHHFTCQSKVPNSQMIRTMMHMPLLVVLKDVNLYADHELTQFACSLKAGTTLEKGSSTGMGMSPTDKTEQEYIGDLMMDTLADICDQHSQVYFKLKKTPAGYAAPLVVGLWKLLK